MRILILGAGRVGAGLAELLVQERNDITVVDTDSDSLGTLQERFDLRTVQGSATSLSVLQSAGIEDTDILIAVTAHDEINLVACQIAHRCFNVPQRIARVRSQQWTQNPELLSTEGLQWMLPLAPKAPLQTI